MPTDTKDDCQNDLKLLGFEVEFFTKRVFQNPDISFLKQIMAHRNNVKVQ